MLDVCAIFKDEAPYLAEWVAFHELIGVRRFFLYDNNAAADGSREVLRPWIERGVVIVIPWPMGAPCQMPAYENFLAFHSRPARWVAFIDVDEFLFSPGRDVNAVLDGLPQEWGAVGVNWLVFGANGQEEAADGLVIERFTERLEADHPKNRHVKTVGRSDRVVASGSVHFFAAHGGTWTTSGEELHGPFSRRAAHDQLAVAHFVTKSRHEWLRRVARGRADVTYRRIPKEFEQYQGGEQDDVLLRYARDVRARLRPPTSGGFDRHRGAAS